MNQLDKLFDNNRNWVRKLDEDSPGFFSNISKGQNPDYMWIGCSDSRVPATQLLGLKPGDIFVHRNIANQVLESDQNCQAAIDYAVRALKVKHIIVCGHYECGGVKASFADRNEGIVNNWLRSLREVRKQHMKGLDGGFQDNHYNQFSEMNVERQVLNVCKTESVREAWEKGQDLAVHGWIFDLRTGLLKDLNISVSAADQIKE